MIDRASDIVIVLCMVIMFLVGFGFGVIVERLL